jgi:threonine dehydratase
VTDVLTVSDGELVDCVRFFATRMKIVVEPTGCLGFAAVRALGRRLEGQRVGVIISGGNLDAARMAKLLTEQ